MIHSKWYHQTKHRFMEQHDNFIQKQHSLVNRQYDLLIKAQQQIKSSQKELFEQFETLFGEDEKDAFDEEDSPPSNPVTFFDNDFKKKASDYMIGNHQLVLIFDKSQKLQYIISDDRKFLDEADTKNNALMKAISEACANLKVRILNSNPMRAALAKQSKQLEDAYVKISSHSPALLSYKISLN